MGMMDYNYDSAERKAYQDLRNSSRAYSGMLESKFDQMYWDKVQQDRSLVAKQAELEAQRIANEKRIAEENARREAEQKAATEAAQVEAKRVGEGNRDTAYNDYTTAKTGSMQKALDMDAKEGALAKMRGVQYNAGDSEKLAGWAGSFMDKAWTEENDTQMRALFDEWGVPEGYGLIGGNSQGPGATSKVQSVTPLGENILTDEDDALGGTTNILGIN